MIASFECQTCGTPLFAEEASGMCPKCLFGAVLNDEPTMTQFAGDSDLAPAIADLAVHFPRLEIIEKLGQGGMGTVYHAKQIDLDREVALKILAPKIRTGVDFATRFAREAQALAKLNHPNVVQVFEFGEADGLHYLLMEYVEGVNLRQTLHTGSLSYCQALDVVSQVCEALQYAHSRGVVHRDIKPENILIDTSGKIKIADFGLARVLETPDSRQITHTQDRMGTPHYMAPEQIHTPHDVDHRADIYALGVVFYEMLTGQLPIGKFAPPSDSTQCDSRLDEVVFKALEPEPRKRYQQAIEFDTEVRLLCQPTSCDSLSSRHSLFKPVLSIGVILIALAGWYLISPRFSPSLTSFAMNREYMINGGFEHGMEGWWFINNSGRADAQAVSEEQTQGFQSLQLTKTGGMPMDVVRYDIRELPDAKSLLVSARIKSRLARNAYLKFFIYDANDQPLIEDVDLFNVRGTMDWRTVERQFHIPEGAESAAFMIVMILDGALWVDDVQVIAEQ